MLQNGCRVLGYGCGHRVGGNQMLQYGFMGSGLVLGVQGSGQENVAFCTAPPSPPYLLDSQAPNPQRCLI